jgi:AP-3 complex subunit delta-1
VLQTTKRNIVDIVKKLLDHIEKAESGIYKDALVEKIIGICSKNSYQHITDFEWYTSVLAELAHTQGTKHGDLLASQFMDVIIRVKVVRPQGVRQMVQIYIYSILYDADGNEQAALLRDMSLVSDLPAAGGNCEVLYAAGWLVGEFAWYAVAVLTLS